MLKYILLVAGFVLLIKGADFFVDGSSSVAKKLKVSSLIIGMTIVAMGTSLPETSVSVSAALAGKNELAVSNVVGSNIFNLMVVCGMCALFCPLDIDKIALKRDFPFSIGCALLLMILGYFEGIQRVDGIILLAVFVFFLWLMISSARKGNDNPQEEEEYKILPDWKCLVFIIGGMAAIAAGGKMVVSGASDIAKSFGMSDNLIGMTIVAFGTSLPELVTSIVAAKKNEVDMALGNVIGSNIFNILFVLGIATTIHPIDFTLLNLIDSAVLIAMSAVVILFCLKNKKLVRWQGAVMLVSYGVYMTYVINR